MGKIVAYVVGYFDEYGGFVQPGMGVITKNRRAAENMMIANRGLHRPYEFFKLTKD